MKTKKEILLEFIQEYSNQYQMEEYPQLTTLFLSEKLNMQRTNISTLLNQLVKEGYKMAAFASIIASFKDWSWPIKLSKSRF